MSAMMKESYAEFCCRHLDAVSLYKDLLKTDRKFETFVAVSHTMHTHLSMTTWQSRRACCTQPLFLHRFCFSFEYVITVHSVRSHLFINSFIYTEILHV